MLLSGPSCGSQILPVKSAVRSLQDTAQIWQDPLRSAVIKLPPVIFLLLAPALCLAEDPFVSLNEGALAPRFEAHDDSGKLWRSTDHVGKSMLVVYFYPADMTVGCTAQACGFRDQIEEFKQAGATVIGVSGDSSGNHKLFKKAHALNFPLLADEDGKVAQAFGVPVRGGGRITRIIQGKQEKLVRGVTAQRWTFVIDRTGRIVHRRTNVKAPGDGKSVLKFVRQLTASTQ
ncbi:MAG: peroxiredoxin [Fuerstiella sp.]|nr:peroxiredoxin [Fuerstiella sp.]MCP4511180.1 peroxiredoxin [Fuerstiella sp.]